MSATLSGFCVTALIFDYMKAKARLVLFAALLSILSTVIVLNIGKALTNRENENFFHGAIQLRHLNQPFNWNTLDSENDFDSKEANKKDEKEQEESEGIVTTCRNSVQGRSLIADDRGFLCQRLDLLSTGCCNANATKTTRYDCEGCNAESGCCKLYEQCTSCCMDPGKRKVLSQILENAHSSRDILLLSVTDQFELCLAKCRTSSGSVRHENIYKDPENKYCFTSEDMNKPDR